MNRRKFISNSVKACASTLFIDSLITNGYSQSLLMQAIASSCTDNILVIVQLAGGNDGLNTIIPLDQYTAMSSVRSNVLIPQANVLTTPKLANTGFHPSMTGMRDLFSAGKIDIVQGCSYDAPDFSHFRATDIWMSGSNSNEFLRSGWIGRELEQLYPGYPTGFPSAANPDPLAIQIGSTASLTFDGSITSAAVAVSSISTDYALLGGFGDPAPGTRAGHELTFLRGVAVDTDLYNARIVAAGKKQATNLSTPANLSTGYLANDSLSEDLKKVARLIKGGLKTRVYMVSLSGFDTHANQVEATTLTGAHATLLNRVSKAITGFQDDLEKMGVNQKVTGMMFSEFGRRVNSNGAKGTDHGSAMPVILFGSELKGAMYGTNPQLTDANNKVVSNIPMQFDYRSVYYSVLKDWFCLSNAQLSAVFGGKTYQYHDLFKAGSITTNIDDALIADRTDALRHVYPNPVEESAMIPFNTSGGRVQIDLVNIMGQETVLLDKEVAAGSHEIKFDRNGLSGGVYIIKMRHNTFQDAKTMVLQ